MHILLLNTAASEGSVALADTEAPHKIIASEILPGRTSSERLVPTVLQLLKTAGLPLAALTAIAVVHGPGSFTGVRIGLSAAKGLSEAAGVPLIAVSRLALLAAHGSEGTTHAVLDAGRGEFYYGEYAGRHCIRETLLSRDEILEAILQATHGGTVIVSEAKAAESLSEAHPRLIAEPTAEELLPLTIERIAAKDFDDTALLDANYLRRTDLEIFAKMRTTQSTAK